VGEIALAGIAPHQHPVEDAPDWLTARAARERFGFQKSALLCWRKHCLYLDGRPIRSRKMRTLIDGFVRRLWRYSVRDLEAIAGRIAQPPFSEHHDDAGTWLSARQIQDAYQVRSSILAHWRNIQRVRALSIPRPPGMTSAHQRLWVYHQGDVLRACAAPDGRTKEALSAKVRSTSQAQAQPLPRRRGRKRSARTQAIGRFCYEQLADEVKRRTICKMIQERFNRDMDESTVTIYARRHARDSGQR
jgi:hypothetical protein